VLSPLNTKEKKNLYSMFKDSYFRSEILYTLFGNKPLSITEFLPTKEYKEGWKAWKNIATNLRSTNYTLRKVDYKNPRNQYVVSYILVGNNQALKQCYNANIEEFKKRNLSFTEIWRSLTEGNPPIRILLDDDFILGILLGYGKENASLFVKDQSKKQNNPRLQPFSSTHPIFYYFSPIMPPQFACDPYSNETLELKKQYLETKKNILQLYRHDDLFELMLITLRE